MMELREQIARAICGHCDRELDVSWSDWLPEADAVIEVLAKQEPVELRFPTMLRKMWSGREVQSWIDDQGPLYAAPGAHAAVPEDIHRDAMRYRALRNNHAEYPAVFAHPGADDYGWDSAGGADLDEIVDELIAAAPKPEER